MLILRNIVLLFTILDSLPISLGQPQMSFNHQQEQTLSAESASSFKLSTNATANVFQFLRGDEETLSQLYTVSKEFNTVIRDNSISSPLKFTTIYLRWMPQYPASTTQDLLVYQIKESDNTVKSIKLKLSKCDKYSKLSTFNTRVGLQRYAPMVTVGSVTRTYKTTSKVISSQKFAILRLHDVAITLPKAKLDQSAAYHSIFTNPLGLKPLAYGAIWYNGKMIYEIRLKVKSSRFFMKRNHNELSCEIMLEYNWESCPVAPISPPSISDKQNLMTTIWQNSFFVVVDPINDKIVYFAPSIVTGYKSLWVTLPSVLEFITNNEDDGVIVDGADTSIQSVFVDLNDQSLCVSVSKYDAILKDYIIINSHKTILHGSVRICLTERHAKTFPWLQYQQVR